MGVDGNLHTYENDECDAKAAFGSSGAGCTARIIKAGWNMDY